MINKNKTELDVVDQKLPCKRKLPDFYHSQSPNDSFYHDQPKNIYRLLYFETLANIINRIKDRFNKRDYQICRHLQKTLIKAFKEQDWEGNL